MPICCVGSRRSRTGGNRLVQGTADAPNQSAGNQQSQGQAKPLPIKRQANSSGVPRATGNPLWRYKRNQGQDDAQHEGGSRALEPLAAALNHLHDHQGQDQEGDRIGNVFP